MKNKTIFAVLTTVAAMFVSCSDMFDNVKKYAPDETVYVEKLDDLPLESSVHIGYERVEIDLLKAGRIPATHIRMNKAKYTVIECEDFTEPGHRRVIDSICSWVNVKGLTQLKTYKLTIYTEDEFGNRSLPLTREVRPYTKENLDALGLVSPSIIESTSSALVEWKDRISAKTHTVLEYAYSYNDKDGAEHTGDGEGDTPSFFVENVEKAKDIPIGMKCRTRPTILASDGVTYRYILDTVDWHTTVAIRISEGAEPAIFLKTPAPVVAVDLDKATDFPINFTWIKVPEVAGYTLKFSRDTDFPDGATYSINMGNLNEYTVNAAKGLEIANYFKRARTAGIYWTVVPTVAAPVRTQSRRVDASRKPVMTGRWLFDDETDLGAATVGEDLIPTGAGITAVAGPTANNKAAKVAKGSSFQALHGLMEGADNYTVKFLMRFPTHSVVHPLLNTESAGDNDLCIRADGVPMVNGLGNAFAAYCIGPNQWHEVVMTSEGVTRKIYMDGEIAYTGTSAAERYNLKESGVWFFAEGYAANDNDVEVAEIAMWDLPLTETEIHASSGVRKSDRTGWSSPYFSAETAGTGPVSNLFDNVASTYWSTTVTPPHYIVIDMLAERNVGRINIFCTNWAGANVKTVHLLVNDLPQPEAAGWTEIGQLMRIGTSYTPAGGLLTFNYPETAVRARYLKIQMPDRYGSTNGLGEIYIYEKVE